VAGALNYNTRGVINKMNDVIRTSLLTKTATNTLSGINFRYALIGIDSNSISGTNLSTVAITKTSEGTITVARILRICGYAGLNTVVNEFSFRRKTRAVTSNVSNLFNYVCRFKAHNFGNALCYSVTAGDAQAGVIGLTLGNRLCISVTAGITASTAVSTGKAVTDSRCLLIFLYSEEGGRNGENKRTYDSDAEKDKNWY
jgi:PIN domain nuclease of toxin-antitoxin system